MKHNKNCAKLGPSYGAECNCSARNKYPLDHYALIDKNGRGIMTHKELMKKAKNWLGSKTDEELRKIMEIK